jgi:transcriptional regulator with XRE-family HTH domain
MANNSSNSRPTSESVAARIRFLRKSRGWTLHQVEELSGGSIKAVVMGSYERGSRALSLARTIELAELFNIPLANLLGDFSGTDHTQAQSMTLDQRMINERAKTQGDRNTLILHSFITAIALRRSDWNGEVLTLRSSDFDTLTLVFELNLAQLRTWLFEEKLALQAIK